MTPPASDSGERPFDAVSYLSALDATGGLRDHLPTGFPSLDQLLSGGPRLGDLVVLAGDTSSGKSSLALAIAVRAALAGRRIALFSGEFSSDRLTERALTMTGKVGIDELRSGRLDDDARSRVGAAALALRDASPLLGYVPPGGVGGLTDLLVEHLGLDLLVVDPAHALLAGARSLDEDLVVTVRELKAMAVRRQSVVLLTTPLAHPVSERPDPRPRLGDLGALGAFAQHADVVLGLFREEQYKPANDVTGATEVHVLKQRNGAAGAYADLFFQKAWLRFEDMLEA